MFSPSKNMSRFDVLKSITLRFRLEEKEAKRFLDSFYPVAFWKTISTNEYKELIKELSKEEV